MDDHAGSPVLHAHLKVVAVPSEDAGTLGRLEAAVMREMDPPLKLLGVPVTELRRQVCELRRRVR